MAAALNFGIMSPRELKHVFPESGGHIALSPRGDRLATGNWNQTIKIWDLASGQFVRSLKTGEVIAMALSPDGQTLATSYWGPEVKLWDVTTGLQIGSLTNNQHRVWSLAFSPDGRFLATGGADQMVRLWDVATRQQTEQLQGHGSEVMSVAFSADGQTLASGSKDKKAMLWSVHPNRAVTTVSNVISRPIFSPDGRLVAAGIGRNKVAAWDVATLQEKAVFAGAHDAVAFSADGSALVTRGTNYFLRTFDVATQAVRETIPGRPGGRDRFLRCAVAGWPNTGGRLGQWNAHVFRCEDGCRDGNQCTRLRQQHFSSLHFLRMESCWPRPAMPKPDRRRRRRRYGIWRPTKWWRHLPVTPTWS